MKKALLIVVIIVVVILALPVINLIRWTFQTKKPMEILLVDKTVPDLERIEHRSFDWVLTNERFVKKENKSSYSYKKDYYGFVPIKLTRDKSWDKKEYRLSDLSSDPDKSGLPDKADAIYFADTYGVYSNDWYRGGGSYTKARRSRKMYGALNNTDNLLIKEMKDRNKLIVLEYNLFDYPTAPYEAFRITERLDIKFSGWTGRYFQKLDTLAEDFPIWMTANYRKQYKQPWKFSKPGVVLVKDKYIIVLEEGANLKSAMPYIETDSTMCKKYNLPQSVAFDRWFDIISPKGNNVISKFKIETTAIGDSLLAEYDLVNQFPAVIQEPVAKRTYYFSGNFAKNDVPMWTSRFKGVEKLKGLLYSDDKDDTRRFFWLYYRPLINQIFTDYYNEMGKK
jgi:hypothetical protein